MEKVKLNSEYISKNDAEEMIEKALRRHNRRSTIISSILGWILIGGYSFGLFHVVQNTWCFSLKSYLLNVRLKIHFNKTMRFNLRNNLEEIKKNYKKRLMKSSSIDIKSLRGEYKEWIDDSFSGNEVVWTLPDLTRTERLDNFCRSIKKRIS